MRVECYVDGVEISKLSPPLPFLGDDDWMDQFWKWVSDKYPTLTIWVINDRPGEDDDVNVREVWVGDLPAWRRRQVNEDCVHKLERKGQN